MLQGIKKGSEEVIKMTNSDMLRWILELAERCSSLDEFKKAILDMLHKTK